MYAILVALLQADTGGLSLNVPTLAVMTTIVGGLVGGIVYIFKRHDKSKDQHIADLTEERDLLLDKLLDVIQTGERTADVGEEAAKLLLKRRAARRPG